MYFRGLEKRGILIKLMPWNACLHGMMTRDRNKKRAQKRDSEQFT